MDEKPIIPLMRNNHHYSSEKFKYSQNYFNVNEALLIKNGICLDTSFPFYSTSIKRNKFVSIYLFVCEEMFFKDSYGQFIYTKQSKLRSKESELPIIRTSNGGVSGLILPSGEVKDKRLLKIEDFLNYNPSFYQKYGYTIEWFVFYTFVLVIYIKNRLSSPF